MTRSLRAGGNVSRVDSLHPWVAGQQVSPAERAASGRSARLRAIRSGQATVDVGTPPRDPITLLEQQAKSRVPELVPIRYGRMLASPFSFYRGAALVMADDLARTPTSGITVQLCGDAHLSNFGLFGTPERRLVFDLNDFDETCPGPWEWDVKRLVTSLVVAAREIGFAGRDRRAIAVACAGRYRDAMRDFASMGNLAVWYASADVASIQAELAAELDRAQRKRVARTVERARTRDSHHALDRLTETIGGRRRFVAEPPLIVPLVDMFPDAEREHLTEGLRTLLRHYAGTLREDRRQLLAQYHLVDVAHKVVGVGSVGTRAWIILLLGRDETDPLILQAKEALPSVVAGYLDGEPVAHEGERVVTGQLRMQTASDMFLGWHGSEETFGPEREFYVRQLRDWKGSVRVEQMNPAGMALYGEMCAWTLARAHARSGDRIAIASYLGSRDRFDRAVAEFAESYADQNERDHAALAEAVSAGRVRAVAEPST